MAGPDPTGNFSPSVFRQQIKQTMGMGLPTAAGAAPIFRWVVKKDFTIEDPAQRPYYNQTVVVTGDSPAAISDLSGIDCAVEFSGTSVEGTEAGFMNELGVKITLLDVDQETLVTHGGRMPDQVLLKGDTYNVDYVPAPQGLFQVDVWTIFCSAQDQA